MSFYGGGPLADDHYRKKKLENEYVFGHVGVTDFRALFPVPKSIKKQPLVCVVLSTQEASVQRTAVLC